MSIYCGETRFHVSSDILLYETSYAVYASVEVVLSTIPTLKMIPLKRKIQGFGAEVWWSSGQLLHCMPHYQTLVLRYLRNTGIWNTWKL